MKQGWKIKTLKEVCRFINGRAYSKHELLKQGKYPVLRVGNFFTNNHWYHSDLELDEDKYCDYGDLLYAWSASFGPRIWDGEKVIYHYHIWKVIPNTDLITKEFLFQLLEWDTEAIKAAHGTGATMMHVGKNSIENRLILLPPLPEQQRIAAILDETFSAIAKAKANAEQNLKNAKELFESYLQSIFEYKGEGWEKKKLGEICSFVGGSQPSKYFFEYNYREGLIRFIQIRDYKTDKHIVYIPIEKAKRFCNETEIMIGRYGPPVFQILRGLKGAYNVALMKAIPDEEIIEREFMFYFLQHRGIQQYIINLSERAVGQTGISKEDLEAYPIYFPNIKKQSEIAIRINALSAETKKLETIYQQKINDLEELKKSILQKAFSGELKTDKDIAA